jgi:hypothetical protein
MPLFRRAPRKIRKGRKRRPSATEVTSSVKVCADLVLAQLQGQGSRASYLNNVLPQLVAAAKTHQSPAPWGGLVLTARLVAMRAAGAAKNGSKAQIFHSVAQVLTHPPALGGDAVAVQSFDNLMAAAGTHGNPNLAITFIVETLKQYRCYAGVGDEFGALNRRGRARSRRAQQARAAQQARSAGRWVGHGIHRQWLPVRGQLASGAHIYDTSIYDTGGGGPPTGSIRIPYQYAETGGQGPYWPGVTTRRLQAQTPRAQRDQQFSARSSLRW